MDGSNLTSLQWRLLCFLIVESSVVKIVQRQNPNKDPPRPLLQLEAIAKITFASEIKHELSYAKINSIRFFGRLTRQKRTTTWPLQLGTSKKKGLRIFQLIKLREEEGV